MAILDRSMFAASILVASLAGLRSASAYPLKMPFRSDELPASTYYVTSGHLEYNCAPGTPVDQRKCPLDISALRWDPDSGQWTPWKVGTGPSPTLQDSVMWNQPIYAPKDGEIIGCWRQMPDDDVDGDDVNCPGGDRACMAGGNHVIIRTYDGHVLSLNHLQQGSIPAALCPIADVYIYNDEPKHCNLAAPWSGMRDGARFDKRGIPPIPVVRGQFLGRVGTSGQGEGAHLHMSAHDYQFDGANPCMSPSVQLEFVESWYEPRHPGVAPTASWTALTATTALPIDGSSLMLWPDPIGARTDDAQLESGNKPHLVVGASNGAVAYRDAAQRLVVAPFTVSAGDLTMHAAENEGTVSGVALTRFAGTDHVAAAVINGDGNLQIIPYLRSGDTLTRGTGRTEGSASVVAAAPAPFVNSFLVAVRNSAQAISLIDYGGSTVNGQLVVSRNDSATTSEAVLDLAIATVKAGRGRSESLGVTPFRGAVTVEQRADKTLVLRSWAVDAAGNVAAAGSRVVQAPGSGIALLGSSPRIAVTGASRELAVVSFRLDGSDVLRSQTYEITTTGALQVVDQIDAGVVTAIAATTASTGDVLTAVSTGSGELSLLSWQVDPLLATAGGTLRREGSRDAGPASEIDVAYSTTGSMIAAARDAGGEIKLIVYDASYTSAE